MNESSATLGRPADRFDVRPESQRAPGEPYVSAWGVWQYNRDAWQRNGELKQWERTHGGYTAPVDSAAAAQMPWEATQAQELLTPVKRQIRVHNTAVRRAAATGVTDPAELAKIGEAAIYLEHSKPAHYATWLANGPRLDAVQVTSNDGVMRKLRRPYPPEFE